MRLLAAVAVALLLPACFGGPSRPPCDPPPAAMSGDPELPSGFPSPEQVTYTSSRQAGPSLIVEGYWEDDIPGVFERYEAAFEPAGDYDVVKTELETDDAEVFFASDENTGLVKLEQTCADYTLVSITVRPL